MVNNKHHAEDEEYVAFNNFVATYKLNQQQSEQFSSYLSMLSTAREQFNLTAISSVVEMIDYHFKDSLSLAQCIELKDIATIADVGTGGGFPAIPLKIYFPHLSMILIEVNSKKVQFLHDLINKLQLENVEVVQLDWRTFLRKARYPIELFLARASLHTDELIRMFQPSSYYKNATLVYWASQHWKITSVEQPFFLKDYEYTIQNKKRKLVFFKENL
jgi:16S rRNA (guanine(527)-N(7))-methyltransferase RsmG